jgi:NhaP-type Na+/H+ or K+/H+ antiporter
LVIGIPVTIVLGTLTAVLLLPVLPLWEAVCLAVGREWFLRRVRAGRASGGFGHRLRPARSEPARFAWFAFAGGLAYAMVSSRFGDTTDTTPVSDAVGELLELLVFAMFGAFAVIQVWRDVTWRVVVFACVALFVVRIVAVLLSMVRAGLPLSSTLFMGWFGPRGIGTLVLGLLVIGQGHIQQVDLIGQAVVVTVALSLVLHSITAPVAVRLAVKST